MKMTELRELLSHAMLGISNHPEIERALGVVKRKR
jgi:hypothetical protein